ncbi:MAG TPA: sugar phosphate isomerase/epimerase [Acidimicrobiales bacterium]|nr:sugar phosphate isomerase/epimerase [Acidimicrobiales bacterium]
MGLDSFSYHRWFGETNAWEAPVGERWTLDDLLEHVGTLDVEVVSIQTVHLPDESPATLRHLRRVLSDRGVEAIVAWGHRRGLEDGRSPERLASALAAMRFAAELGCGVVRVVCGDQHSWLADPAARRARLERLRAPLATIARAAGRLGVTVAIENHADVRVAELVALVRSIGSERLGICLDVGNAARVGDEPAQAARAAADWTVMAHLRDLRLLAESRGRPDGYWPCVPLGAGDLDLDGVLRALAGAGRCEAWLVEASNMLPGYGEEAFVTSGLAYLRAKRSALGIVPRGRAAEGGAATPA